MAKTEIANMNILGTDYELTYQDVESDPATVEGARQRLGKLGYLPVKDEAYFNKPEIDFAMDHFMLCFQADHGLEIHGEVEREATEGLREGIHLSVESTRYQGAKFSDSFAAKIQAEAGG
jgi:hypothetical protein